MATARLAKQIGNKVTYAARNRAEWYSPHMIAASRAISERIPLADLVVEVRDARIPVSSGFEEFGKYRASSRWIVALNKMDLADKSQTKEWRNYFEKNGFDSFAVNVHRKDNVQAFLNFLRARVRELRKRDNIFTTTILLVGIPNVGKSALANSLHKIGRISAAEKGKLKNPIVSPHPGDTRDISSLKIGSYPNIYVLDTPGVLPPRISDVEVCSKLFLTGALSDGLVGVKELSHYFLSILNSSDKYEKWSKLSHLNNDVPMVEPNVTAKKKRRKYLTDHTQDFIVNAVRQTLFEKISSFDGDKDDEMDSMRLIESEMVALEKAFRTADDRGGDAQCKVAAKLLDLYRIGRLGHYTLDSIQ